jgi:hypothetical protein
MPFTVEQLENIANASMDYHYKVPEVRSQTIQDKPLLQALTSGAEEFPGGKEYIDFGVKGEYTTGIEGFGGDDEVDYDNPANLKRGKAQWKLLHAGIEVTMDELLRNGISISDTTTGKGEVRHSEREKIALADLMKDKVEDMMEGSDRALNLMLWRDGTSDSTLVPGIRSFVVNDPTTASVVLGIDQSANSWWRNRARLAMTASTAGDQNVVQKMQRDWRQIRRYGGKPNLVLAGSDYLDWVEQELRSKGNYTLEGWTSKKSTDASIADITFKGVNFQYDPTLDDESLSKYCYALDTRTIKLKPIAGEDGKDHRPARPHNKYVFYRAKTWAWGLICRQRNAQQVWSIA